MLSESIFQNFHQPDIFYCRPLENYKQGKYWYIAQPRGKHYLNDMIKNMCREADIDGYFTNHSLRASGASTLFQSRRSFKKLRVIGL